MGSNPESHRRATLCKLDYRHFGIGRRGHMGNTCLEGEVAHESIIDVLRTLPTSHRNFLFDKFHARMPDTNRVEPKLERLAELLGSTGIQPYRDLYQHKGGLLSWYVFDNTNVTTRRVQRILVNKYPGIEDGLTPELEWNADPVPYAMRRRGDVLILKLAALDGEREFFNNWKRKVVRYDVTYVIVLRDEPFTIEVRSAYGKVEELYRTVSAEIGLRLDDGDECKLDTKKLRSELKKLLDARCFFAQHRHADIEVAKTTMEAQPKQDLERGQRLKDVEGEAGVTGFSRWYDFEYKHSDGYVEYCVYKVKLSRGQVRVGKDTSEPAIKELEKHVVSLFTR